MKTSLSLKNLLWIDAMAALISSGVVFILKDLLTPFLGFPQNLLFTLSLTSLGYACFSFSLASRKIKPKRGVQVLVVANFCYATFCVGLMLFLFTTSTLLGSVYLTGEALFVFILAALEWKQVKKYPWEKA